MGASPSVSKSGIPKPELLKKIQTLAESNLKLAEELKNRSYATRELDISYSRGTGKINYVLSKDMLWSGELKAHEIHVLKPVLIEREELDWKCFQTDLSKFVVHTQKSITSLVEIEYEILSQLKSAEEYEKFEYGSELIEQFKLICEDDYVNGPKCFHHIENAAEINLKTIFRNMESISERLSYTLSFNPYYTEEEKEKEVKEMIDKWNQQIQYLIMKYPFRIRFY